MIDIEKIKRKIKPILKKHDVKRAAIFGSYARGEQKKKSDVDVLIKYKRNNKSYFDLVELENELKNKLKRKVDLLTYDGVHPYLKKEIFSSKIEIM
jgi:predicted nucleotidyltransferase